MMRAMRILLLCWGVNLAAASMLRAARRNHGTVAQHRAALLEAAARKQREMQLPIAPPTLPDPSEMSVSTAASASVPKPISADTPESMANVLTYQVHNPTPLPAVFGGEYCRGGACQYRVVPPPPIAPTIQPILPPPVPIGGNMQSGREFCRGLTCLGGMGVPGDPTLALWNGNCMRLYNDIAGGMVGLDSSRTVEQAYQSFMNVCKLRVNPLEAPACPAYANTIIGAEAQKVNSPTVGGAQEVCTDHYWFLVGFKQAEIDLKLTAAALPKAASLLSIALNRFGTGGVGPTSRRGLKWREYLYKRGKVFSPPLFPEQLGSDGGVGAAFMQTKTNEGCRDRQQEDTTPKPPIPGADSDEDTPRGLPKYLQNPPCDQKPVHNVPQSKTKYQIAPGSPDGLVPPVEIDGDLFNYCANQFSEIMMGFTQTAPVTVQMTHDWCAWQASVSSWVGKQDEFGHPDWDHRTCANMEMFMAFVLKDDLKNKGDGLTAQVICKKIFLTIGATHRSQWIVDHAWDLQSVRAAPEGGGNAPASDKGMQDLMKTAQEYASKIFNAMRKQKEGYEALNNAKMDASAFDSNNVAMAEPPPAPALPDSDDLDTTALISLSTERVRLSMRVGHTMSNTLKPWGHAESTGLI